MTYLYVPLSASYGSSVMSVPFSEYAVRLHSDAQRVVRFHDRAMESLHGFALPMLQLFDMHAWT